MSIFLVTFCLKAYPCRFEMAESNSSRNPTKCYYNISINSLAVLENLGSIPLYTSAQPEKTHPETYAFIWRQYAQCDAKRNVRCISGDSERLTHIRDGPILRCQLDARFCCMSWRFTMWSTLLQSLTWQPESVVRYNICISYDLWWRKRLGPGRGARVEIEFVQKGINRMLHVTLNIVHMHSWHTWQCRTINNIIYSTNWK